MLVDDLNVAVSCMPFVLPAAAARRRQDRSPLPLQATMSIYQFVAVPSEAASVGVTPVLPNRPLTEAFFPLTARHLPNLQKGRPFH